MRVIDWERLLKEQRIPYIESGANVKRGEMAIKCPFCGTADPSMHMGLNRENGWWSCWRNRTQHSGKSPLRLLMKLLRCSYGQARELAGLGDDYVDPEGFDAMAAKLMLRDDTEGRPGQTRRRSLRLDESFAVIKPRGRTKAHFNYLYYDRGFDRPGDIESLGVGWGVCAGLEDEFKSRVILPYYLDHDLVTWTGRAIADAKVRYRDLPIEECIIAPKKTLFNYDNAFYCPAPRRALIIVEGPLDALKLDLYGLIHGVRAVALSTNSISAEQGFLLQAVAERFDRVYVMLDNASVLDIADSMRMMQDLSFIDGVSMLKVPYGAKDAGELTPAEVNEWAQALTEEMK